MKYHEPKPHYDHGQLTGKTVQTCPECQSGKKFDNETGKHIPADEHEFKYWQGTSLDLMRRCWQAVNGDLDPDVCANNIVIILPMGVHEAKMIQVLLRNLKEANKVATLHAFESDIEDYTEVLQEWKRLVKKAKKVFPTLTVVQECKIE
jgi:hypothetical protein